MTEINVNRAIFGTHCPTREELHRTYGGEITAYEFDGYISLSNAAANIAKSWSFDRTCEQNIRIRSKTQEN